jgi:hypothetical protein
MVGVRWPPPTDEARLFGHELDVLLVAKAAWLRASKPAFVNAELCRGHFRRIQFVVPRPEIEI